MNEIAENQLKLFLRSLENDINERTIQLKKGNIIAWQGDNVQKIMVIKTGTVKVYTISLDGEKYVHGFLGKGGLIGATEFLANIKIKGNFEAMKETDIIPIPIPEFENLLSTNHLFSNFVLKRLARDAVYTMNKVEGFGLCDVQQRLKQMLHNLALSHGVKTEKGIKIALDITHNDIAELIGAYRTTITHLINDLRKQGYLLNEGRKLIIASPEGFCSDEGLPSIN
jgi:CRP/FNR family transcriptional regulator, cyclic AMP receptor protein